MFSKSHPERSRPDAGFTLLELIVVITIIGIMSTFVLVATGGWAARARHTKIVSDLQSIVRAAEIFNTTSGRYPESIEELLNYQDDQGNRSSLLESYPKDPWKHEYIYEMVNGRPHVKCLGSDGQEGGDGEAKDEERPEAETQ